MRHSRAQSLHTVRDLLHSLRNSLSLISGESQYLLSKPAVDALCGHELRIIQRASERAASELDRLPASLSSTPLEPPEPVESAIPGLPGPGGEVIP
jgi:nitrogen-specific signal transduction histidine kinase